MAERSAHCVREQERGCERLSRHGNCVTAGGGDTSRWPAVAAAPPGRSCGRASPRHPRGSSGLAGAGLAPGSCLSPALQLRMKEEEEESIGQVLEQ